MEPNERLLGEALGDEEYMFRVVDLINGALQEGTVMRARVDSGEISEGWVAACAAIGACGSDKYYLHYQEIGEKALEIRRLMADTGEADEQNRRNND
jgi:hypothetical protein